MTDREIIAILTMSAVFSNLSPSVSMDDKQHFVLLL
jgi:hypothetical protein